MRGEGRGVCKALTPIDLAGCRVWQSWRGDIDGPQRQRRARSAANVPQETLRNRPGANRPGGSVVQRTGRTRSGRKRQGAQSSQGATELVSPGPALGKMQGEAAGRAGEPSGEGEETPPQGLGGGHVLAQSDAGGPAGQQLCWLSRKMGNFGGTRTTPCRVIFDHGV